MGLRAGQSEQGEQAGGAGGGAWTIGRLIEWTREFFSSRGIDDARLEAELLLAHALGVQRIQLYVRFQDELDEASLKRFRELVRERARRVPTQYLMGVAYFRNLTLKVTPAVLIPRPETELVVDEALALLKPRKRADWAFEHGRFIDLRGRVEGDDGEPGESGETGKPGDRGDRSSQAIGSAEAAPAGSAGAGAGRRGVDERSAEVLPAGARVLDLCTGSGCIALAIAAECPGVRVWATDVSAAALAVAGENAARAHVAERVTLLEGDLWAAVDGLGEEGRRFDLITCNPPYIAASEMAGLMPEVRDHEPREALTPGVTGFEVIDRVLAGAVDHLRSGGHMLMEIGYQQGGEMRRRAAGVAGLELVEIRKDLGGHERVVHLRRR